MRVSTEAVATREVELTVEPDAERISRAMRQAARRISKARPVAGFRPGKAPYEMVERIFGRETILNEALNDEAPAIYREAIKEAAIEPYEQTLFDLESEDPVVLKIRVPLMPTVTLGDYAALTIEAEPQVSVSDAEIDKELETVQHEHAEYEPVERPIQMGDRVAAAIIGTVGEDRVIDRQEAFLTISEQMMPPGFAEAIMGASAGEQRTFALAYPEDFDNENLAGKTVSFEVTIKTVQQTNLPPIDDELAKMAGEYETLAQLRDHIAELLATSKAEEARERETGAATQALVGIATIEYPAAALENEITQALNNQRTRLSRLGLAWDRYLQMTNQTEETLREQLRPAAERSLVERLALAEYARLEGIELDPNEIQDEFRQFAQGVYSVYGERAEEALRNMTQSGMLAGVYAEGRLHKATRILTDKLTGRAAKAEEPLSETGQALSEFLEASQGAPAQE